MNQPDTHDLGDDAPDTPAPLFAIRAFKQAIFGTPKAAEPRKALGPTQPRRRSAAGPGHDGKTNPPEITHLGKPDHSGGFRADKTPGSSPQKRTGILSTPGTLSKNRKTVSFDAKKSQYLEVVPSTTPTAVPGRFPTPRIEGKRSTESIRPHLARNSNGYDTKLGHCASPSAISKGIDDVESSKWLSEPEAQFERGTPSDDTKLEMRKLLKREQVARQFAKFKDDEARQLQQELMLERAKVAELEGKLEKYLKLLEESRSICDRHEQIHIQTDMSKSRLGISGPHNDKDGSDEASKTHQNPLNSTTKSTERQHRPTSAAKPKRVRHTTSVAGTSIRGVTDKQTTGSDIWAGISPPSARLSHSPYSEGKASDRNGDRQPLGDIQPNSVETQALDKDEVAAHPPSTTPFHSLPARRRGSVTQADRISKSLARETNGSISGIDGERKEAARKRLEEKRKARLGR